MNIGSKELFGTAIEHEPYDSKIEYLQSSGTQHIDTLIEPTTNLQIVTDIQPLENTGNVLFGYCPTDTTDYRFFNASGLIYFDFNASRINGSSLASNTRALIEIGNYYVKKNGQLVLSGTAQASVAAKQNITVFGGYVYAGGASGMTHCKMRLYSFKMADNGIAVRDMIPVRVGNVGYMYDKVSKQLFGNAGTGNFILGPDVK